jgi:hypothetical protein
MVQQQKQKKYYSCDTANDAVQYSVAPVQHVVIVIIATGELTKKR